MRRIEQESLVREPACAVVVPNLVGIIVRLMVALHHRVRGAKPQIDVAHFRQASLSLSACTVRLIDMLDSSQKVRMAGICLGPVHPETG